MTRARLTAIGVILLLTSVSVIYVVRLQKNEPPRFTSPEDQFKYGSIGAEDETGIPYWLWQVLPRMFADKLPGPGGYASLGVVWEEGRELPIGFSKRNVWGISRVAINCAFCHTATFRTQPEGRPTIVPAGPSHQIDSQGYIRFLLASAEDPRFNASQVLAEIEKITDLPWLESLTYRFIVIPMAKRVLRQQHAEYAWMDQRPAYGTDLPTEEKKALLEFLKTQ